MVTMPDDIVDLDSMVEYPNILVFSKPKAGKTRFACSDDNILILNCEDSGVLAGKRSPTLGKNVKQWQIHSPADYEKAVSWLKGIAEKGNPIPFTWVVLDTITTLQKQKMRDLLDNLVIKKPHRNKYVPDKPEYMETQQWLADMIKKLNDLPVNVLILAHTMQQADPEGKEFYYPMIQGGKYELAQQILAMMTSFGYLYVKTREKDDKPVRINGKVVKDRYIMWEDFKQMQGGDRTGALGQFTKNKTLKDIRLMIENADNEGNED